MLYLNIYNSLTQASLCSLKSCKICLALPATRDLGRSFAVPLAVPCALSHALREGGCGCTALLHPPLATLGACAPWLRLRPLGFISSQESTHAFLKGNR